MKAQNNKNKVNIGNSVKKSTKFVSPFLKGLIYSSNNGWYHTSKVHDAFGFDFSVGLNGTFVPITKEIHKITIFFPDKFKNKKLPKFIPMPVFQLNVGLPFKFETSFRFIPKLGNNEKNVSLFGFGIKKEFTNLLFNDIKLPFHFSLMGTYTNIAINYGINTTEENYFYGKLRLNSYSIQLLSSLNLQLINLYGSIGYGTGDVSLNVLKKNN